jgi:hypothetical protein
MFEREQVVNAVNEIVDNLAPNEKTPNLGLLEICRKQGIESLAGDNDFHLAHEILEVAVNKYVSRKCDRNSVTLNIETFGILSALERLEKQIPTQTWRSGEQHYLQQFSIPPCIAFLMAKILNPCEKDWILEPSAGTGVGAMEMVARPQGDGQILLSRPSGKNIFYTDEAELAARYRLVPIAKAKDWWNGEVKKIPPFVKKDVFILSGALIPVWRQIKNVKNAAFKIVRTTTNEGMRLVGLQVPKTCVKEIVRLFDCA